MSDYSNLNSVYCPEDAVITGILNQIPREPHTVVYHGGPWHGKREPYDPEKRDVRVAEPMSNLYYSHPNDTMLTQPKIVRYTPKTVRLLWDRKHYRKVVSEQVAIPYFWVEEVYDQHEIVIDRITFSDSAIAMVAEDWKGEPIMEEKDYYGRKIAYVDRIYKGHV
jgi:hypothetical protein